MKTASVITVFPTSAHKVLNGYNTMSHARPFQRTANRAWRKQVASLLICTPGASHADVEWKNGMGESVETRRFALNSGQLCEVV